MGHYAFINDQNIVTEVITGKDESDKTEPDWEVHYAQFRTGMICRRTSYNTQAGTHLSGGAPYRKNYAGIGFTWDEQRDAFIPPKLFASWTLNEATCQWEAPIAYPTDGKQYTWEESTVSWVEFVADSSFIPATTTPVITDQT
jgi:hypothetical protein